MTLFVYCLNTLFILAWCRPTVNEVNRMSDSRAGNGSSYWINKSCWRIRGHNRRFMIFRNYPRSSLWLIYRVIFSNW